MSLIPDAAIRKNVVVRLTDVFRAAPIFTAPSAKGGATISLSSFVQALEAELFARHGSSIDAYRGQLFNLMSGAKNIVSELASPVDIESPNGAFCVERLAGARELLSSGMQERWRREQRKRARENTLVRDDDVHCRRCKFPVRAMMNTNRFGIDDENLGNQYDNNYDDLCHCDTPLLAGDEDDDDELTFASGVEREKTGRGDDGGEAQRSPPQSVSAVAAAASAHAVARTSPQRVRARHEAARTVPSSATTSPSRHPSDPAKSTANGAATAVVADVSVSPPEQPLWMAMGDDD